MNLADEESMMRTCWITIFMLLLLNGMSAQDTLPKKETKPSAQMKGQPLKKKPPAPELKTSVTAERRVSLTDSLVTMQMQLERQRDSFSRVVQQREDEMRQMQTELTRRKEQIRNYEAELSDLRGDNLQSSHTNSILFIFNIVVGILLVVSLGWMYLRKRSEPGLNSRGRWSANPDGPEPSFDHRLDRIQKLGSLRDRGLLTEEEFNLQKRQILGE